MLARWLALALSGACALLAQAARAQDAAPPAASSAVPALQAPELLEPVAAEYPEAARRDRVRGRVVLRLSIDIEGRVTDAEVLEAAGHGFDEAARDAVLRFRFRPALKDGVPVPARIAYAYDFELPEEPAVVTAPADAAPALSGTEATPPAPAVPAVATPAAPLEVSVRGVSTEDRLRRSSQAVKVVDTEAARHHSTDVGEILARTEGVALQRTGGMGSTTRLSLHGLTDDQIRVFLDGVPLELSGFGLGIATVPVYWLERIEVYRGVVPVRYGSDALGGAIDLVTSEAVDGVSVGAAYTAGAFDTHQLALQTRAHEPSSGFFSRVAAFYDRSKNDYVVDVEVPDALGQLRPARVRRFHDDYEAGGASVQLGWVRRPWARRLLLELFASQFGKDLQHNVDMSVPYGEVEYGQRTLGGTLRYEQPRLGQGFARRFAVSALAAYSHRQLRFEDTAPFVYDWYGNRVFERAAGAGELSVYATDLTQWEDRALTRAALSFDAAPGHVLRLISSLDVTLRTGQERLRVNPERIDPETTDRSLLQLVSGLEYAFRGGGEAGDVVENGAFAKHYVYHPATDQVQTFDNSIRHVEDTISRFGAGDTLRVRVADGVFAKASYEYATRLPRPDEVFGDGALVAPNLDLTPESSHNANLGALLEQRVGAHELTGELSGFLRDASDMIVELATADRVHSIHQNVFSVRTVGVDGMLRWESPARLLTLQVNATWQDQRNVSERGAFAPFDGQRVPNRPWLFANTLAMLHLPGVGASNAALDLAYYARYVHDFRPGWADTGALNQRETIPDQLLHSVEVSYSLRGPWALDLALDVQNLTDARAYDVLGVQKPGRAAFFKVGACWACASALAAGAGP